MAMPRFKAESGVQLFARLIKKPGIENFYTNLFQPGLKHGDIVEISVDRQSSYSYLLIDLICEALLPSKAYERPIGVLVFNTDGQLNFKELIYVLKKKILHNDNIVDHQNEMNSTIHRALSNLFILDIYDATQFYTTIYNLDDILTQNQHISLLIFDTLTAFYWSEQGFKMTKMDFYIKNLLTMIQKVTKEYKIINIYTRPGYFSSNKDSVKQENNEDKIGEGVNYRVQINTNTDPGAYQIIVKTLDLFYIKSMNLSFNEVKWH